MTLSFKLAIVDKTITTDKPILGGGIHKYGMKTHYEKGVEKDV